MSILKIGARLIKSFGSGENLRRVITETVDGKTFTNIYDAAGNLLRQRVKEITRYSVGNKNVITIKKINSEMKSGTNYPESTTKNFLDKVYDKAGKLLGFRKETGHVGSSIKEVKKLNIAERYETEKTFDCGKANYKSVFGKSIRYNNKGLPMPQGMNYATASGKSIAEMNKIHMEVAPDVSYAPGGFGLDHLNGKYVKYDKQLNELDQYLA